MTTTVAVPAHLAAEVQRVEVEIAPEALYPAHVAAIILGYQGTRKSLQGAMYKIPQSELRRIPRGPRGKRYGYRGADLLAYRERAG